MPLITSDESDEEEVPVEFNCISCKDLVYKPTVLPCGHVCCFGCCHTPLSSVKLPWCYVCFTKYRHFPRVCGMLHSLLAKKFVRAYKKREKYTIGGEQDKCIREKKRLRLKGSMVSPLRSLHQEAKSPKENSISDVLCVACKQFIVHPVVLSCGDVYCKSCLLIPPGGTDKFKCGECGLDHYDGRLPGVCQVLDKILKDLYPQQYDARTRTIEKLNKWSGPQPSDVSGSSSGGPINAGICCDVCGMFPIIGDRYQCIDCLFLTTMGHDLCKNCYENLSHLPGRVNQEHKPEHGFSRISHNIYYKQ